MPRELVKEIIWASHISFVTPLSAPIPGTTMLTQFAFFNYGTYAKAYSKLAAIKLLERHGLAPFIARLLSQPLTDAHDERDVLRILIAEGLPVRRWVTGKLFDMDSFLRHGYLCKWVADVSSDLPNVVTSGSVMEMLSDIPNLAPPFHHIYAGSDLFTGCITVVSIIVDDDMWYARCNNCGNTIGEDAVDVCLYCSADMDVVWQYAYLDLIPLFPVHPPAATRWTLL